jgi:hypothetical protein
MPEINRSAGLTEGSTIITSPPVSLKKVILFSVFRQSFLNESVIDFLAEYTNFACSITSGILIVNSFLTAITYQLLAERDF